VVFMKKCDKRKGFTLIEVLGVIVILLLLVLITTPIVINYLKKANKDAENVQEYTIKEAAKSWLSSRENISLTPVSSNECIEVTLRELKEQGYVDYDIKNPKNKELLSDDLTVVIRKEESELTYEINDTGNQTCNVIVDSEYPRWTYVSSNKNAITKDDTVVIKIKSTNDISEYELDSEDIIVKAGSEIVDNATIDNISCTGTNEITCEITISNLDKDGNLNLIIDKDTLTNENDKKSRKTPVLTNVIIDNQGPTITYIAKSNTNESGIYATDDDEIVIVFDIKDVNISTDLLNTNGIEIYVGNTIQDVTKLISRESIENGYRYELKLTDVVGDGELSIKIKEDQISDTLGNKNEEKIITPGITIDNILPEITFDPNGENVPKKSVSTKITATDDNGVKDPILYTWSLNTSTDEYRLSASNESTVTLNDVTGDYYLIAKACDLAGNCTEKTSDQFKLSNRAPEIIFVPNGNTSYESNKDVIIRVVSSGADLNLATLKYSISQNVDDEPTREFTNNESVSLENLSGTYYIIAYACNILDNCTRTVSNPYHLDGEAPKVKYISKTNTNRTSGETNEYATSSDSITLLFEATDNISIVDSLTASDINIRVNGEIVDVAKTLTKSNITNGKSYTLTLENVTGNGILTVEIDKTKIKDNAGNDAIVAVINPGIIIDNDAPIITLNPDGNNTYAKSQSSIITVTDNKEINDSENLYIWSDSITNTPNINYTNGDELTIDTVSGDYYLIAKACDKAGNCTNKISNVFKLINQGPKIAFGTNGNNNWSKTQSTTIDVTTLGSELNPSSFTYIWTNDPTNATPNVGFVNNENVINNTLTGEYYLKATACDILGNCTTEVSNVFKFDNEAPIVTLNPNGNATYQTSQSATVTITDNHAGGNTTTYKYIWSENPSDTATTSFENNDTLTKDSVTGTYYLIVHACDNVGNCQDVVSNEFNISNEPPIIEFGTNGNSDWSKTQSTTINVIAGVAEVDESSLKYIWTTDINDVPTTSFTSGSNYTKDGVTGDYYLIATACDVVGNCGTYTSNVFKLDNEAPTITFGTNGNGSPEKVQSSTITVYDEHSKGNTLTYKYVWSTDSTSLPTETFISGNNYSKSTGDGNYYLIATACDNAENCTTEISNTFLVDNTAPTCSYSGENTAWTTSNVTVTLTCNDLNGCKTNKSTNTWSYTSGTHKIETILFEIEDNAGNTRTCSKNAAIYLDKEGPTVPTNGSIGTVSGSDTTGTIETPASGSTDLGVGNITYRYFVNTTGITPSNDDSNFKTSMSFERSCGTDYYAYAIAIDGLGNRSNVAYLGSTGDGEDSYSTWSACSASCGGGIQTRTNSCALITEDLSQSCNLEPCCQMPDVNEWEYNYTGDVQSFTAPEDGIYKLEVYGAEGGSGSNATGGWSYGAKGGYAAGNIELTAGETVYIVVGGAGQTATGGYNGGGAGGANKWGTRAGGGGGATHIATTNRGVLSTYNANRDEIIIVAGGGGGAGGSQSWAGAGGGEAGGNGGNGWPGGAHTTLGGTQTSTGGASGRYVSWHSSSYNTIGGFGYGGNGGSWSGEIIAGDDSDHSSYPYNLNGGGGAGWYGGGGGHAFGTCYGDGGGGGSGYIGGVDSGTMDNGVRSGDGYAKITLIKLDCDENDYDLEGPTVIFGTNGNSTYAKSQSSTITVIDNVAVDESTLKYIWTTDISETPATSFENGSNQTINNVTGDYYLKVHACDTAGNCTTATSAVFKLDNEAPIVTFGTNGNESWSKTHSTTINVTDEHSQGNEESYNYTWGTNASGTTPATSFTNNAEVSKTTGTGNYYVTAKACDNAGNCTTVTSNAFKLDNEAPVITFNPDGNTTWAQSQSSTITVSDNKSGGNTDTYRYTWSELSTALADTPFASGETYTLSGVTGEYYLIARACDNAGNCADKVSTNKFNVSNSGPSITFGTNGSTTYKKSQSTTIIVTAGSAPLDNSSFEYTWGTDSTGTTPTSSFTNGASVTQSTGNGNYYVTAKACDTAGNCTTVTSSVFLLDNEAPTIVFGTNGNSTYQKSQSSIITASDDKSGIKNDDLKYTWSTSTTATPSNGFTNGAEVVKNTESGNYYIVAKACDNAGNCTTVSSNVFKLDNEAPVITFTPDGNTTYAQSQSSKIEVTDGYSGGKTDTYKYIWSTTTSATPLTAFESGLTYTLSGETGDYYLIAHACDNAGNCTDKVSTTTFNVSNSGPTITFGTNGNSTYAKSQSTTIIVSAGAAPIKANSVKYAWGTSSVGTTPTTGFTSGESVAKSGETGDYYVTATACDTAGNCTTVTSNAFKLDNEAPTITYGTNGNNTYLKSQSTTITASDNKSGVKDNDLKYIWSTTTNATPNVSFVNGDEVTKDTDSGNYYIVAKACDNAGNCATVPSSVFKLDNEAPTITLNPNGNTTYAQSQSSIITVSDTKSGGNAETYKYIWSTSNSGDANIGFANNEEVSISGVTGTYYLIVRACDNAGNCADKTSTSTFNVSNQGPTITFSPNGNETYAKSQSTVIAVTAGGAPLDTTSFKYTWGINASGETPTTSFINGGTVTQATGNGNYYVTATACDTAGNCTTVTSNAFKLDNLAPTITFGTNGNSTYAKNQSTTINVIDNHSHGNEESYKYVWGTNASGSTPNVAYTSGGTVTQATGNGNYYVTAKACDNAGNCTTVTSNVFRLDNEAPVITFTPDGNETYAQSQTSKITVTDGYSGGKTDTYKYIWSTTTSATPVTAFESGSTYTLSGETGNYYLIATACDKAGNCADKVSATTFNVSNQGPTITFSSNGNETYAKSQSTTINVTAGGAPIRANSVKYAWGTNASGSTPSTSFTSGATVTQATGTGNYYVTATACDTADNCTTVTSNAFKLDNEAPVITYTPDGNTTYAQSQTSKISVTDGYSGGNTTTYKYTWSADATATANTSFTSGTNYTLSGVTGSYYLIAHACDNAGNCADKVSTNVFNVSNSGPTITFGTNGNETYAKSQSTTINVTAGGAPLDTTSFKYTWGTNASGTTPSTSFTNNAQVSKDTETGNYYVTAKACDTAGNCTTVTSNVFKLDNIAPTITFGTNGNSNWSKTHSTTINVLDSHSGEDTTTFKYTWGTNASGATPTTSFVNGAEVSKDTETGNYYITAKACDNAGNCTTVTSNVFKFDNTAPTCTFTGENTTWTRNNVTVTVTCNDLNGCKENKSTHSWTYSSGTHRTENLSYEIEDNAGNVTTCSKNASIFVDKEAPTVPVVCNIGTVSGSDTTGTIETPASGSTDLGVGNITYKYIINTTGTTPANTDTNFGTSMNFARSCGTSYYAYAVAIDGLGNISTVKSCGTTSDGVDSYTEWGSCSASCGGGTQTRTNTCALVTEDLSQSCNTEACCQMPATTEWEFNYNEDIQAFIVPENGTYKLEVYGAQGGSGYSQDNNYGPDTRIGGKGGYSSGYVSLTKNQIIYVVVGGAGSEPEHVNNSSAPGGYNGGGTGKGKVEELFGTMRYNIGGSGGGATHIGTFNSTLAEHGNTNGLYIVAGGGGGSWPYGETDAGAGGAGGGLTGEAAQYHHISGRGDACVPGSQTGTSSDAGFGYGGPANLAGGGGGLYGGGSVGYGAGACGGSGYIGGVSDGTTEVGVREGNGYAKITLIKLDCDENDYDLSGPTITFGTNGNTTYAKSQSSTITVTDNVGVDASSLKYIWTTNISSTPTTSFVNGSNQTLNNVTGTYYLKAYACDVNGNCTTAISNPFKLDNIAPEITFGTNGNTTYAKSQSSTIIVTDLYSGGNTETYKYVWSTSTTATPTTGFISGNNYTKSDVTGDYYLVVTACDNAGNCTSKQASNVFKLDNEAPTITLAPDGNTTYAKSQSSKITVTDNKSGGKADTYKYIWSTSTTATPATGFASGETYTLNGETGDYYLIVHACDNAGNCADKVSATTFNVSNSGPTITFSQNGNSTYAKSQSTKITVTAGAAPVVTTTFKYAWGTNASGTTPSISFTSGATVTQNTETGNYYVTATACDVAGNCTTVTSNAFKLDNEAPTITFGTNGNSTYAKSQSSTINVTDNHSLGNSSTYKYIWTANPSTENPNNIFTDGASYTKDGVTGDYYLKAYACDNAGNCTTVTSNAFKLDNEAPTITFTPDGNTTWAKTQSSKITVTDNKSGGKTDTYKYTWSTSTTATPGTSFTSGSTYTLSGETGTYYLIATACDKAGNCADKVSATTFNESNQGPTITFGTNGNSNYAKSASSTINVTAGAAPLDTSSFKYKWVTSADSTATPTTAYTNGQNVKGSSGTGNYYIKATACDIVGNCTTTVSNVFKLDNLAPTITFGTNGNSTYQKSQSSTINVTDGHSGGNAETYVYTWSTSTTATPGTSFTSGSTYTKDSVTGNYYLIATACDNVGNCSGKVVSNVFKLDNEAPIITYTPDGNTTYAQSQSSTISVNDTKSGGNADTYVYTWSTSTTATPDTSFTSGEEYTLSGETGSYYLIAHACDNAGNCADKVSTTTFNVSNQGPTITFGTNGNTTYAKTQSTTINVTAGAAPLDTTSFKYSWGQNSSGTTPATSFTNGGTVTQGSGNGNYYVTAKACDVAGNCTTVTSNVFRLDNEAPTITFTPDGNTTYAQSQSSKIEVSDNKSGGDTSTYVYTWSTSSTATPATSFTSGLNYTISGVTGDYYLIAHACDNAGNCADKVSTTVFKVSNSGPTITFGTNGNSDYAKSQSSTINVTSTAPINNSSLKYIWVSDTASTATPNVAYTNGGEATKSTDSGDYYIKATACDTLGNCTTVVSNVFKLDNEGPTITFSQNGNSNYAKSQSSKITISDSHSGGDTATYKGTWSTSTTATPTVTIVSGRTYTKSNVTGDYYLIAHACDTLGNCTTEVSNVFKLDNEAPTITFTPDGNTTWAKTQSSTIAVSDGHSGGNADSYLYTWSTDSTATAATAFTSGTSYTLSGENGSFYLIAHACDNAGNCADKVSATTFNESNSGPTITFSQNGNSTYAKSQSTTITVTKGTAPIKTNSVKYIWGTNSEGTTPSTGFTSGATVTQSSGNGDYYVTATACDTANNCTTVTSNAFKLDNEAPTITFGTNGNSTYAKSQSSTISASDDKSGVKDSDLKYIWSTSTSATPNTTFVNGASVSKDKDTGDYYIVAKACDNAGNCTTVPSNVFKLDNEAPTITLTPDGNSSWAKSQSSKITITENKSGGKTSTYKYIWSTEATATADTSFTNNQTVSKSNVTGEYYLIVRACDNAGNCADKSSLFKLDNEGPTIKFVTNGNSTWAKTQSTVVNVTTTGAQINSESVKYIWTTTKSSGTPDTLFTSGDTITKDSVTGTYYLRVKACDTLGNCTTSASNAFKIDNTAPTITLSPNGNSTPAKSQSSTITVEDNESSGKTSTYKYIWSTSNTANPSTGFASGDTVAQSSGTGNYYLIVTACDNATNCTTKQVSNVFVLDNTAPTCSYSGENTTWVGGPSYNDTITVTVTCNDANGCKENKSTKSWSYSSGTHKTEAISFEIEDVAGNKKTCSKNAAIYLDKEGPTAPTCSAPTVSGENTTGTLAASSGSTDTGVKGISYNYYVKNNSTAPANTDTGFGTSRNFTRACGRSYYAYSIALDSLGNRSTVTACGNTADAANSYSEWSECSESCGGGTQTRTNSCALITTGLSQECNTQSCCQLPDIHEWAFDYNDGNVRTFVVPETGTYKLEVWGAKGGDATNGATGGLGGYAKGNIQLTKGTTLYIYLGGQGSLGTGGFNGGGTTARTNSGGGGGATHIGTFNSTLAAHGSNSGLYIVAGGGGGAGDGYYNQYSNGGGGGGLNGIQGFSTATHYNPVNAGAGYGGTQTSGGSGSTSYNIPGSFGQGGNETLSYGGAGGGGGYYGGGSGTNYNGATGGGGGSSYVGGVNRGLIKTFGNVNSGDGKAKITLLNLECQPEYNEEDNKNYIIQDGHLGSQYTSTNKNHHVYSYTYNAIDSTNCPHGGTCYKSTLDVGYQYGSTSVICFMNQDYTGFDASKYSHLVFEMDTYNGIGNFDLLDAYDKYAFNEEEYIKSRLVTYTSPNSNNNNYVEISLDLYDVNNSNAYPCFRLGGSSSTTGTSYIKNLYFK